MLFNRRAFLQQAGFVLTTLGVSQTSLLSWATRYQQALAEPTRRKLALLIGINQYPESTYQSAKAMGSALTGCVTDVELQRELLVHRFGFQPNDVFTLTNERATREAIETAFLDHLVNQARSGDVVVFHFSGYGSQVKLNDSTGTIYNSLVPVDGYLPTNEQPIIHDLMEDTLWLLLRSLKTQKVTTVLDLSYNSPGRVLQSSLHLRSRPLMPIGQISDAEQALQEKLLAEVKVTPQQIRAQQRAGQAPGILLAAAQTQGIAAESQWNSFSAGLFTYALTQQLWWATPATTLRIALGRAAGQVEQHLGQEQQPQLLGQASRDPGLPLYFLSPAFSSSADGVVTAVEDNGNSFKLWLGGLPPSIVENYTTGAIVQVVSAISATDDSAAASGTEPAAELPAAEAGEGEILQSQAPLLQIRSRNGLVVRAKPYGASRPLPQAVVVGNQIWEVLRLLPKGLGLTVALDSTLERIERVDATSAFSSVPSVSSVITGDQPADCFFGKAQGIVQAAYAASSDESLSSEEIEDLLAQNGSDAPQSGYGLFWVGRAAIPNTLADGEEAVKTAITRLTPQLQTLLALKLLRLTANAGSSRVGVRATLEMVSPQERIIMQQQVSRSANPPVESQVAPLLAGEGEVPIIPVDSRIQYRLENFSDRPLYFILLGLDSSGSAIALYPAPTASSEESKAKPVPSDSIIHAGETLVIPQASVSSEWVVHEPKGFAETHLIFSPSPLTQTYNALSESMRSISSARRVSMLSQPLNVARAVLQDIHQASMPLVNPDDVPSETYAMHTNAWATLSFVYQVI
ncbi:MAG: caspase family protein [Thainema sp.]